MQKNKVLLAAMILGALLASPLSIAVSAQIVDNQTIIEQPAPQPPIITTTPPPATTVDDIVSEQVDEALDERLPEKPSPGTIEGTVLAGVVSGTVLAMFVPYWLKMRAKEEAARSQPPDESNPPANETAGTGNTAGHKIERAFSEGDVEVNFPFQKKYFATGAIGFFIALMTSLATWGSLLATATADVGAGASLLTVYINASLNAFGIVSGINLVLKTH